MHKHLGTKDILFGLALTLCSVILVLILFEIALRLLTVPQHTAPENKPSEEIPLHITCDCPYLYQLNPNHPRISSQGLRDREYAIPKPKKVWRILVLGDSITFGLGVRPDCTFVKILETRLRAKYRNIEVINASVMGYTAYNEVQFYIHKGRLFQPDIVVIALCLNDVVDPLLHWNYTKEKIMNIPEESIPNPEYHKRHILPLFQKKNKSGTAFSFRKN